MKRTVVWGLTTILVLLSAIGCFQYSTGSAELDNVLNADYEKWRPMVENRRDIYVEELKKLNPLYQTGTDNSITISYQQIILSLFAIKKRKGTIVELGSWIGGGALMMAPHLKHKKSYHAVDTFNAHQMPDKYIRERLEGRPHLDVFMDNIEPVKEKVVVHQGLTNDVVLTWPEDKKIDFLFIDADHSYEAVSADWKNWSPYVRKGGIIAFHDYYRDIKGGHPGVKRFVDESIDGVETDNLYYVTGMCWYIVQ